MQTQPCDDVDNDDTSMKCVMELMICCRLHQCVQLEAVLLDLLPLAPVDFRLPNMNPMALLDTNHSSRNRHVAVCGKRGRHVEKENTENDTDSLQALSMDEAHKMDGLHDDASIDLWLPPGVKTHLVTLSPESLISCMSLFESQNMTDLAMAIPACSYVMHELAPYVRNKKGLKPNAQHGIYCTHW